MNLVDALLDGLSAHGVPIDIGDCKGWVAPSESDPNTFHLVVCKGGAYLCTCPGFRYHQRCRHIQDVLDHMTISITRREPLEEQGE